ncbi:hypothetical protein WV31_09835 [Magnetospirillum sp. ME-1]|nr:hypothetical protein WV31_09835 [Magnetospirillum sp. ME-1]
MRGENADVDRRLTASLVALAVSIPVIISLAQGIGRPYTLTPDADIIYVGEVLRSFDGRPYFYSDHPGYTYTLALSVWLKLLSLLHLIPKPGLAEAVAAPSIDSYMQAMVWAGRWLSALMASALVAASAWLVRLGGAPPLVAALFALLLACSGGIAVQAIILRAELMSAGFTFLAYCSMAVAARHGGWRGPIWLGLAGFLAMLAMEAKVQAMIPLLALPPLAVVLDGLKRPLLPGRDDWRTLPLVLVALALCMPLAVIVPFSMADFDETRPYGFYQLLIAAWVLAGMAIYAQLNRVRVRGVMLAVLALAAGMALGLDVLFLRHSHRVMDAVINPLEHMRAFAGGGAQGGLLQSLAGTIPAMVMGMVRIAYLPLRLMELAALAGATMLWRGGDGRAALQSVMLVGVALAVEIVFGLRGMPPWYLIYIEPWVLAALLTPLSRLLSAGGRFRRPVFWAVAVFLVWTGARALSPDVVPAQPIANVCAQANTYLEPELAIRFGPTCRN